MAEWTKEAECAVRLCEDWADQVAQEMNCQLFLFGSAIYKFGEQFDGERSDLDIVMLFSDASDASDALGRVRCLTKLFERKQALELRMLPALHRRVCDEPGVSIVAITEIELQANIHKSGARNFFDKNFFYDLLSHNQSIGIPAAGTRVMRDEGRQAFEYVQAIRNQFLSVCANGTGGLMEYCGADPMPKALLRSAAQLVDNAGDGEWYDTRRGLELLHEMLLEKRTEAAEFADLFDRVSVRRGGRGKQACLSSQDQLLLAEMLFDKAARESTDEALTWEIKLSGKSLSEGQIRDASSAIQRILPGARLIGPRSGSQILKIRSSFTSLEFFEELHDLGVLARLLRVEDVSLARTTDQNPSTGMADDSREAVLVRNIIRWAPREHSRWLAAEADFGEYLKNVIELEPRLHGARILRNVAFDGVEIPFEMDFLLMWGPEDGIEERIGIEVVWLRTPSTFFQKVAQVLPLGKPVILVMYGPAPMLRGLNDDIGRLQQLNANVRVVPIAEA